MEIVSQTPEQPTKAKRFSMRGLRGALTKRRKMMILAGMFVLLIVTGYLNFTLNSTPEVQAEIGNQCMFDFLRTTRTTERETQLTILTNMATNTSYSPAAREKAEQQKLALLETIEYETVTEGLILAAGFDNVVVAKNGESVNVVVQMPEGGNMDVGGITPIQATQIRIILQDVATWSLSASNIVISVIEK